MPSGDFMLRKYSHDEAFGVHLCRQVGPADATWLASSWKGLGPPDAVASTEDPRTFAGGAKRHRTAGRHPSRIPPGAQITLTQEISLTHTGNRPWRRRREPSRQAAPCAPRSAPTRKASDLQRCGGLSDSAHQTAGFRTLGSLSEARSVPTSQGPRAPMGMTTMPSGRV